MVPGEGNISVWIKHRRHALDLTQEDLAECVGCSTVTVQKIEAGERRPSKQIAQRLAECLQVPGEEREAFIRSARGEHEADRSSPGGPGPEYAGRRPIPNNLPLALTSLIGRETTLAEVRSYLLRDDVRLVTLTGPPGIGKTRLALQVGADLLNHFKEGVFFVNLAPLTDSALVPSEVARELDVREVGNVQLIETLAGYLRDKQILLVLDNFEQVIGAAPVLAGLVQAAPRVKVLVTSREVLQLRGEKDFPVPPLSLPDIKHLPLPENLDQFEAVKLFVERATDAKPDFEITGDNAAAIAEICYRLDGLPLAIELAAARIRTLTPQAIFARLQTRLRLLTGGARDLPPRQQTLRAAIEWSYLLLDDGEKELFRRLGVFVGGGSLEAVEAVCAGTMDDRRWTIDHAEPPPNSDFQIEALDRISSLVNKSLLRQEAGEAGEPRYVMLQTIREYALEKLEESGELNVLRRRHALHFTEFVEQASPHLKGSEQVSWVARMEAEHDNIRAALHWSLSEDDGVQIGLRIAAAAGRFWNVRAYFQEGLEWLSSVLSRAETHERNATLARAFYGAGSLAYMHSDYRASRHFYEESLAISRELADKPGMVEAIDGLGEVATEEGDYAKAIPLLEEALAISRELQDTYGVGNMLIQLGWAAQRTGEYGLAAERLSGGLALYRQLDSAHGASLALSGLGEVAVRQGEYGRAVAFLEESLALRRALGHKWGIAVCQGTLAWAALCQADYAQARQLLGESIAIRREIGDKAGVAWCLEKLAQIAFAQGYPQQAVCLYGATSALRQSIGSVVDPADQPEYKRSIDALKAQLGNAAFQQAWTEGREMTLDQAISSALSTS